MGPKTHSRAATYGAAFIGHSTDAQQLQRMRLHDLAKREPRNKRSRSR